MAYNITFVGAQANELTPTLAVYAVDSVGRLGKKIATAEKGQLALSRDVKGIVALGPDVPDPSTLDSESLLKVRVSDQAANWAQNGILIPAQWWRIWLGFLICLSGKASRCFPLVIDPLPILKANALRRSAVEALFPRFCSPLCNGVVEVWENTCCCWPILIYQVPSVTLETTNRLLISRQFGSQGFERKLHLQALIETLINLAHASAINMADHSKSPSH